MLAARALDVVCLTINDDEVDRRDQLPAIHLLLSSWWIQLELHCAANTLDYIWRHLGENDEFKKVMDRQDEVVSIGSNLEDFVITNAVYSIATVFSRRQSDKDVFLFEILLLLQLPEL